MDLSSLALKPYSELTIKHPVSGIATDIVISLYGKDSKKHRESWQDLLKLAASEKANGTADFEALALDVYVLCTKDWVNVELDGEPLECTPENVRLVYSDDRFTWLHDQVIGFMESRENFI